MNGDLATNLTRIGLRATAEHLNDFIARATTKIGLVNILYNMKRVLWLSTKAAPV